MCVCVCVFATEDRAEPEEDDKKTGDDNKETDRERTLSTKLPETPQVEFEK